jgi:hypothetical protein
MDLFGNERVIGIDIILKRSSRAICGINEREVLVKNSKVYSTKRMLKSKGFMIVGTGKRGASTVIWFNPIGGF